MAAKPADFFIGVVDLFSIFLAGALLSFLFLKTARDNIFCLLPRIEGVAANWIAFALASYLLGHFASLVGAVVLDRVYDRTFVKYKRRHGDHLYNYARKLKANVLGREDSVANAYKWARANVRLRGADGAIEIDRLEADSKFFRSVSVVLGVSTIVFATEAGWRIWLTSAVLTVLSCWRFADLRWKGTETAYLCLVVLETGRAGQANTAHALS
jgi:hypothetical protein